VSVARGGSGAGACVASSVVSLAGFDFLGLEALEDAGGEMVYFEVILVCGVVSGLVEGRRGEEEAEGRRRTVAGRACRRRVDCVSHC
jgi:hypothetical protein